MSEHISVFKKEAIDALLIKSSGTYVDLTLGGGGHASQIWQQLGVGGTLVVFDVEERAVEKFAMQLGFEYEFEPKGIGKYQVDGKNLILVNANFERLSEVLQAHEINQIDGVLADLGWSTDQLESIPGLSYQNLDAKLDMRMDEHLSVKASDLLNALGKKELVRMFVEMADIPHKQSNQLAQAILQTRKIKPFEVMSDLIQTIESVFPSAPHRGSRKGPSFSGKWAPPSALVLQALRIAVNNELSTLQSVLPQAWNVLASDRSLIVITFHSGEEKVISQFVDLMRDEGSTDDLDVEVLRPSVAELKENLRARSAKLWIITKYG